MLSAVVAPVSRGEYLEGALTALENQARHSATLGRPWPATIPFDLLDFALGTGWLSFLLIGFGLARWRKRAMEKLDWVVLLCLGQIVLVAVAGLIPTETARVWLVSFAGLSIAGAVLSGVVAGGTYELSIGFFGDRPAGVGWDEIDVE